MPAYDFKCDSCGLVQEIFRKFGEKMPETVKDLDTICCERSSSIHQIIHPPSAHVSGTTTIGSLAEQNSKRMGKGEIARLTNEYKTKKENTLKLNSGMSIGESSEISKSKIKQMNKINRMSNEEKRRYIEKGDNG